jgi:hypothetical protein
MTAREEAWTGWQQSLSRGKMWASPDKDSRYLRRSVLRPMARNIGEEEYPEDFEELVELETFEDTEPSSQNAMDEITAGRGLAVRLQECVDERKRLRSEVEEEETITDSEDEDGDGDVFRS